MLPEIIQAINHGSWVELHLVDLDESGAEVGEQYIYVLHKDDPFGIAPALRRQLQTMVDEEGFEIEGGLPADWPWWVPPPPVEPDPGP